MSEEKTEFDPNKKRNRKKRKDFLSNAKKYAKKGQMGRGTKMSEELYQYFIGILDAMKKGIDDDDEKRALVNNVLERTKGEELNIIGNQIGCRVIELLLPYSSEEDLERYTEIVHPELRRLFSDNFTSHVIETLLTVCSQRASEHLQESLEEPPEKKRKKDKPYSESHLQKCHEFTIKLCKYTLNNLEDFVWDSYGNHIVRCAIKCLSGITHLPGEKPKVNLFVIKTEVKGIPPNAKIEYRSVPLEFSELVKEFCNRLSSWPQFKDFAYNNLTSGLIQVLLYAMKNIDKNMLKELLTRLLNESFAPDDWVPISTDDKEEDKKGEGQNGCLPPVFDGESSVRLLEAALFVAKKKVYTQIYAKCFINRLAQLAVMPSLNYTVQRLFDNCQMKEEFEPMFEELSQKFDTILVSGNTGVLLAVAKACHRIKAKQAQFISSLETSLKCVDGDKQKYFPICCLRMLPLDRIDTGTLESAYFINVHGSIILQTMLDFQRPAKPASALLELSSDELMVILSDAKGCHVADSFFKGQFVGVKSRDKMIWKLKGYYQTLALSQYGSRSFEQIFQGATIEQKVKIMTEISEKANLLNSTQYGRLIANKLNVELFKKSIENWKSFIMKDNKSE